MKHLLSVISILSAVAAASAQPVASGTFLAAATAITAPESPPASECRTNLSILPASTDYWSATITSQKIQLSGTTNVCRLYVKGDNHNSQNRPVYAQIRTAANGGGSQIGGNSTTNTVLASAFTVVELTFVEIPQVTGDYWVNIRSAEPYNHYLVYSLSDEYAGSSYCAMSDATARTQDLWLIVCYQ